MITSRIVRVATAALAVAVVASVAGCAPNPALDSAVSERIVHALALASGTAAGDDTLSYDPDANDWVIVHFADNADYSTGDAFDQLADTEYAAADALAEGNDGWLDGNEVGGDSYDLYFFGYEKERVWAVLEPVFEDAPVAWTSVELFDGLEDESPELILPGDES